MKHAVAIAVAAAAFIATSTLVNPGAAQASPYLQLAADTAAQLNAQELGRIQSGAPPMAPPPAMTTATGSECPPGKVWEPDGYGKHAKWRPAGCYRK